MPRPPHPSVLPQLLSGNPRPLAFEDAALLVCADPDCTTSDHPLALRGRCHPQANATLWSFNACDLAVACCAECGRLIASFEVAPADRERLRAARKAVRPFQVWPELPDCMDPWHPPEVVLYLTPCRCALVALGPGSPEAPPLARIPLARTASPVRADLLTTPPTA